jgi:hypothetical protein
VLRQSPLLQLLFNEMKNIDEKRLDEIRKFFWNYKYTADYDEKIYQMVVELISYIDALKL